MFDNVTTPAMLVYLIILLLLLILLTLFALLVHSGIFKSLEYIGTGKPPIGQVLIAYKFQKGPYNEAGQTFTEAAVIAPKNKTLGIYYDNPEKVEAKNLRYVVGSILSSGSETVPEEQVKQFTKEGFKILHLPEVEFVVRTKFPHITSLSILIAIYKAYPNLKEYIDEHKLCAYPFIEYYDGEYIHFMAPLSKQDQFYVPECEESGDALGGMTEMETTVNTSHSMSLLNTTQNSMDTTQDESVLNASKFSETEASVLSTTQATVAGISLVNSDQKEDEEKPALDVNQSNMGWEGKKEMNEDKEEEQAMSDGSSSSFEVLKDEPVD